MDVWVIMHVCKLEILPKDIAQNEGLFIDFKGLHIVQHITIVSVKGLHLLVVVFHFLDEVQQLLFILPTGTKLWWIASALLNIS